MSTRTIIEINHDYLGSMTIGPTAALLGRLLDDLAHGTVGDRKDYEPPIRILGQRHHSEPEWKQEPDKGKR